MANAPDFQGPCISKLGRADQSFVVRLTWCRDPIAKAINLLNDVNFIKHGIHVKRKSAHVINLALPLEFIRRWDEGKGGLLSE